MFVVEAGSPGTRLPWIAGLFVERRDADLVLAAVQAPSVHAAVYEIPFKAFPIYLIEDQGFRFVDQVSLREYLATLDASRIADDFIPIIYRLDTEFGIADNGRDQMGALNHIHVDH